MDCCVPLPEPMFIRQSTAVHVSIKKCVGLEDTPMLSLRYSYNM